MNTAVNGNQNMNVFILLKIIIIWFYMDIIEPLPNMKKIFFLEVGWGRINTTTWIRLLNRLYCYLIGLNYRSKINYSILKQ